MSAAEDAVKAILDIERDNEDFISIPGTKIFINPYLEYSDQFFIEEEYNEEIEID